LSKRIADYVFHPPSGSSVPGKVEANPYIFYPPDELRKMIDREEKGEDMEKMKSALKQWERIYVFPGYPWRISSVLRKVAHELLKMDAAQAHPSINIPYYQETDVPEGYEGILQGLAGPYDDQDSKKFDYARQGIRPKRDQAFNRGDFLSPSKGAPGIKPPSESGGSDPAGLDYPFPPTGGNLGGI